MCVWYGMGSTYIYALIFVNKYINVCVCMSDSETESLALHVLRKGHRINFINFNAVRFIGLLQNQCINSQHQRKTTNNTYLNVKKLV